MTLNFNKSDSLNSSLVQYPALLSQEDGEGQVVKDEVEEDKGQEYQVVKDKVVKGEGKTQAPNKIFVYVSKNIFIDNKVLKIKNLEK